MKIASGIAAKNTQLAWAITLASLCLFVAFTMPGQKRDLQGGLESKGQSITAGLEGEVAGAAVTEDYSAVVEQAMQVVAGDPTIEFIVISKMNGYSVVVKRDSWRIVPRSDPYWYSGPRVVRTGIGVEPLIGKRIFHYRAPLNFWSTSWGWIHVGLSLDAYDRSVHALYLRTALVGVLCLVLSLIASVLFSKRFVRPILDLRRAVEKVAKGDLEARARMHTHDEIEDLGTAFNHMAEAILQRNRIVESVRFAAQTLQSTDGWDAVIEGVLARFGETTASSRVLLVERLLRRDGMVVPTVRLEWAADGVAPCREMWTGKTSEELGWLPRCEKLAEGKLVVEDAAGLEAWPVACPPPRPLSLIAAPVDVNGQLWGALVLHDCRRDRAWSEVEQHSVRAIADMVGASIMRERAQLALRAANNELERRVAERTLELSDQIAAKDKAHKDLQQAQQKLIELSRLSGMAEVATGVLHNVGNALNSINVSATLIAERMNALRIDQLRDATAMLAEKNGQLAEFLVSDPRGQRVIPYLAKLSGHMQKERGEILGEAVSLLKHVGHVKEIVSMQQGYARSYGVLEKVTAEELIENALSLSAPALARHGIEVVREYEPLESMIADRHKVLQILLNLLQNAKDAVKAGGHQPRRLQVRLRKTGDARVRFEVEDNGVGIAPENLSRIFSHGFTTKRDGHGFGLHSGALAAQDLGGTLAAASAGLGQGATFALELPFETKHRAEIGG